MTIHRLLVANRGEIAVRIIRACRELGIETVLAHSEPDRESLGARLADQTVCIGPGPSEKSYLNIPNIVSAALITGCDALHPGYGFLAENAYLAEACTRCNLTFVGPPARVIEEFSNKVAARRLMAAAGLPIVPGSEGIVPNLEAARSAAAEVGFPVMLKADAGGGGRGMRTAANDEELVRAFQIAQAEALASFGNGDLYVERFVPMARHIEVQLAVDNDGHAVHLGERDCSLQRRHQKLLEEAPSPALSKEHRRDICETAVRGARFASFRSVGTMEFILDPDGAYYFIEMNTRLQVEHPVTEMVTGIDIAKLQIRLAAGEPLPFTQESIRVQGHAMECRIVAEDPDRDFGPEFSPIREYHAAGGPGIRVDSHVFSGYEPPPFYDSLLSKVIAWGTDREEAMRRMERALTETRIIGPKTSIPYQLAVLRDDGFRRHGAHTQWTFPVASAEPNGER
ncbi:MAG TPA: acetyl-CoA carboxylase biotin carboxylase subunit [Chloroflexota bacterium]|nr:acetyl-CoA carboxylase biotin carboxylase subunit [Chloroflexota bacterium]